MLFTDPIPFAEALEANAVRTLLPTELRTKDLAQIEPALLARSRFSAGVANAGFLQEIDDKIGQLTAGEIDRATARRDLKAFLGSLGDDSVDNADLTDLRSDARLNLILDTNLAQAQGYGQALQGAQADVLDQWPAAELVDSNPGQTENRRDWAKIWADAINELGAATSAIFYGGRMVALKFYKGAPDPIWAKISRFGTPYEPFDFGSYWVKQDVDREEAEEMRLLRRDEPVEGGGLPDFNLELEAAPDVRADWLRSALAENLQGLAEFAANGVLRLVKGAA